MGSRGPAPKPTSFRLLQGNCGHQKLNRNEPKPRPIPPKCPQWLAPEAKAEWKRLVPELGRVGLLTVVDKAVLAGYCQSWAEWRTTQEFLEAIDPVTKKEHGYTITTPNGYIQQRPEVAIGQKARKDMLMFGVQLGLSPSSRTRISVEPSEGKSDPFEEWRSRGSSG